MSSAEESRGKRNTGQRPSAPSRDSNQQNQQNRKNGKQNNSVGKTSTNNSSSAPSPAPRDEHAPVAGFNSADVETLLKRGFDAKASVYKPDQASTTKAQPWGAKPGAMASGKDFWLELRKQIAALQKGDGTSKGG